jgi:MFS family permease
VSRLVLAPFADRIGARRVVATSLAGMGAGAILVLLGGTNSIIGLAVLGLTAAPVFPLLTLTTRERVGADHTDRAIGVQVAASAAGAAVVPPGVGLLIGHYGAAVFGPSLVVLVAATAMAYLMAARRPAVEE